MIINKSQPTFQFGIAPLQPRLCQDLSSRPGLLSSGVPSFWCVDSDFLHFFLSSKLAHLENTNIILRRKQSNFETPIYRDSDSELPALASPRVHTRPQTHLQARSVIGRVLNLTAKMSEPVQQGHQEAVPASNGVGNGQEAQRPVVAADDNLSCQWDKCSERCISPEALFVRT